MEEFLEVIRKLWCHIVYLIFYSEGSAYSPFPYNFPSKAFVSLLYPLSIMQLKHLEDPARRSISRVSSFVEKTEEKIVQEEVSHTSKISKSYKQACQSTASNANIFKSQWRKIDNCIYSSKLLKEEKCASSNCNCQTKKTHVIFYYKYSPRFKLILYCSFREVLSKMLHFLSRNALPTFLTLSPHFPLLYRSNTFP